MKARHLPVCALALLVTLLAGCGRQATTHVLFVGNSLTYVGNLPAVLGAMAKANGHMLQTDMIVKGGATLTDRVNDGSVKRALAQRHYDIVVLQERGFDFACGFGPAVCSNARASLEKLAQLTRTNHATPLLLGTYQDNPEASDTIVQTESAAAHTNALPYVAVSGQLGLGLKRYPAESWFYTDGIHPGHELVLLESVLLYRQLFGTLPQAQALDVQAPMYGPKAKFQPPSPVSLPLPNDGTPTGHAYSVQDVEAAIALARGD
ncbi:SGNH/GDSL hydrolase family protein [Rhodanobacter sp. DHG33]|uniref:SGNH/GDSL hydrolase family protein n=1 Tax=Rhodanobacter sp. DHG33 TaxID=2775921 RepID=UPI0017836531|nr:SGNH/GDSL hydrolase family protein [Rhodanobacter sp. DHG33]MBD8900459.1 SGNH/GDSL hydrolase family protein [Rhodanobacter sp. DHG33]